MKLKGFLQTSALSACLIVAVIAGQTARAQANDPAASGAPAANPAPLPPGLPSVTGTAEPGLSPLDAKEKEEKAEAEANELRLNAEEEPEYRLNYDSHTKRMNIAFYWQMSQFERTGEQLLGYALEVLAGYAMTNKIAFQMALMQAATFDGAISLLYSGIRTSTAYAIDGDFMKTASTLEVNDLKTINFRSEDKNLWAIDGGLDQYFFNGVSRIVPATGISATLRHERTMWGVRASVMGRYGLLVISEAQAPMISVGGGLAFTF